ncbi:MAG: SulP family inorganic anion transporter [Pseudomonadales bacterium]
MHRIYPNALTLGNFRGDLYGGLTAGIVALPLAIAFGVASGMGPVAGLYGAICVGLMAALFGGTPSQISGPTGPMTIVAASVFTQYSDTPAVGFTIVALAGALQVLFGYLRLGRYVNLLPYPVISGFMTGIGGILIIMQLDPLLGYPAPASVLNALSVLPVDVRRPNLDALLIGSTAFAICMLLPRRISALVPAPLFALIACTLLALVLADAPRLGQVPSGLPQLHWPELDLSRLSQMLVSALVLAALGSVDSLLTSLVADNATRTFHDSDKELVGQGFGNVLAGLLGGLPGAGATVRTLANIKAGGRTPISGVIHALLLLAVVLGFGQAVAYIPLAALAGILFKVGIDVVDWRYVRRMHRAPALDRVLMVTVFLLTVLVDVITAVGVGVVLASLAFVKEMADLQARSIRTIGEEEAATLFNAEEAELLRQCAGRALVLHLSGLISFGAANDMTRRLMAGRGAYDVLLIDLLDVPHMDGSAALALEQIIERAQDADQQVIVVGLNFTLARSLGAMGVLDRVKETERVATRLEAVRAAVTVVARRQATGRAGTRR